MDDLSDFKRLLHENLEISKQTYKNTEKIRKYFFWSRFFKSLKWLIILASLFAGFLYSKPYLKQLLFIYKNLYEKIISLPEAVNNKNSQIDSEIIKNFSARGGSALGWQNNPR